MYNNTRRYGKNKAWARRVIPLCLCGVMGMALLSSLPANAQSTDVLNRIKRIENEIDTLNRAVYKGEAPPPVSQSGQGAAALMEERLSRIENDLRGLTGRMEEHGHEQQQLNQRFEALEHDMRVRLEAAEAQMRAVPPVASNSGVPPQAAPAGNLQPQDSAPPPMPTPVQNDSSVEINPPQAQTQTFTPSVGGTDAAGLYEKGFAEIKQENFAAAESTFSAFIQQYPDHALSPNAYYWLGETYYVRKDYDKAARTFAEAYQKYPNGPKGADNLLKLGMSLSGKGEKDSACVALKQLKTQYPQGPAPVLTRGGQEMQKLGCS